MDDEINNKFLDSPYTYGEIFAVSEAWSRGHSPWDSREAALHEECKRLSELLGDSPEEFYRRLFEAVTAWRLRKYSPGPRNLEEEGLQTVEYREPRSYLYEHRFLSVGRGIHLLTPEAREDTARLIDFLAACKEDPRYAPLWRLLVAASGKKVRSPRHFGGVLALAAKHRSPGRATRVMLAAQKRADKILAPWGLQVPSRGLASALAHSRQPGRVAHKAVLWTLRHAFGLEGRTDMAAFRDTSRSYRRLVAVAGSVKDAQCTLAECPPGEPDTPRARLARGLAAVRRLRYVPPETPLIALVVCRTVECSNNTSWLLYTRQRSTYYAYTMLPRWYLRRKEYIVRTDADGTRTPLLQSSRTQIGICTVWKTHMPSVWYVEGPRGRTYHTRARSEDRAVSLAKEAWQTQRQIGRKNRRNVQRSRVREQYLSQYLQDANRTILVRISDSVATGNCPYGTEQWRDTHFAGKSVIPLQALLPHRENLAVNRVVSAVLEREMSH